MAGSSADKTLLILLKIEAVILAIVAVIGLFALISGPDSWVGVLAIFPLFAGVPIVIVATILSFFKVKQIFSAKYPLYAKVVVPINWLLAIFFVINVAN